MSENICEAFARLMQLGIAAGVAPLNKHAGCWEYRIDDKWEIAVNGHKEAKRCSHGVDVEPYHCYVQYNGWPAGIFNPRGGTIAAGECANENAFIAAMEACLSKLGSPIGACLRPGRQAE